MSVERVSFRIRRKGERVGTLTIPVSQVIWGFAVRLYVEVKPESVQLEALNPLLLFHRRREAPFSPPPVNPSTEEERTWSIELAQDAKWPVVEARLTTGTAILKQGYYRLHDVVGPECRRALKEAFTSGQLAAPPGEYEYDVELLPQDQYAAFSEDSFELRDHRGGDTLDFEEIEDAPRPSAVRAKPLFTVTGKAALGTVQLIRSAWTSLVATLPMPLDAERGGYLVGEVRDGSELQTLVKVLHAVPATLALSDAHRFLMSPESGSEIRGQIDREWPELELVGWYHSHIFSPQNEHLGGLSATDITTHNAHFTRPWQLAGLINVWRLNGTIHRQLRIYQRDEKGELVEADYDVIEEAPNP